MIDDAVTSRRRWLTFAAAGLTACSHPAPQATPEPSLLGKPVTGYGERSAFEAATRALPDTRTPETAASRTPLQDSCGILTPSSLHYERHHAGVPRIDPAAHRLMIHGLDRKSVV